MRKLSWVTILFACLLFAPATVFAAGPVSFGTGEAGTADYNAALAIAKAAMTQSGLDIRPRPFKGAGQAVPFVDSGEINFGLSNGIALLDAYNGSGINDGTPLKDLRLVGTIFPFRSAFIISAASPARTTADLRGLRVVTRYRSSPATTTVLVAILAAAGLTVEDVEQVEATTSLEGSEMLKAGQVDAVLIAAGAPALTQFEQVMGPLRFLSVAPDPQQLAAVQSLVPNARIVTLEPKPNLVGVIEPTSFLEYDYYIYSSIHTPDDVVVSVIDALVKGKDDLVSLLPAFAWLEPAKMVAPIGIPYHPAAVAHY